MERVTAWVCVYSRPQAARWRGGGAHSALFYLTNSRGTIWDFRSWFQQHAASKPSDQWLRNQIKMVLLHNDDFPTAASWNGFSTYKFPLHKKTNIIIPNPGGQKWPRKLENRSKISSAGCSFLRTEASPVAWTCFMKALIKNQKKFQLYFFNYWSSKKP